MAETFLYTNASSEAVTLNDNVHRYLIGFSGVGMEGVNTLGRQLPYHDGETHLGLYTPRREVTVVLDILAATQSALVTAEQALRRLLNPYVDADVPGVLRFTRANGVVRAIRCFPVAIGENSADRRVFAARRAIRFVAADPWWYDPDMRVVGAFLLAAGGLEFPWFEGATIGFPATTMDNIITAVNEGDVDTWPVIVVEGPGEDPVFTNNTSGKVLSCTESGGITLDADDTLTVDMEAATIEWYDDSEDTTTSMLGTLTAASEFWPLVRGANEIRLVMASAPSGTINVTWYDRYIGA